MEGSDGRRIGRPGMGTGLHGRTEFTNLGVLVWCSLEQQWASGMNSGTTELLKVDVSAVILPVNVFAAAGVVAGAGVAAAAGAVGRWRKRHQLEQQHQEGQQQKLRSYSIICSAGFCRCVFFGSVKFIRFYDERKCYAKWQFIPLCHFQCKSISYFHEDDFPNIANGLYVFLTIIP